MRGLPVVAEGFQGELNVHHYQWLISVRIVRRHWIIIFHNQTSFMFSLRLLDKRALDQASPHSRRGLEALQRGSVLLISYPDTLHVGVERTGEHGCFLTELNQLDNSLLSLRGASIKQVKEEKDQYCKWNEVLDVPQKLCARFCSQIPFSETPEKPPLHRHRQSWWTSDYMITSREPSRTDVCVHRTGGCPRSWF